MSRHAPRSQALSRAGRASTRRAAWTGALCLVALDAARAAPPVAPRPVLPAMDAAGPGVALDAIGDGRLRHRGDGFTATIYPDGSVEFRDRVVESKTSLFGFDPFTRELKRPKQDARSPAWAAFEEKAIYPMGQVPLFVSGGAGFGGLSDWLLPEQHASAKRALLEATAPLRRRMAYAWQRARLKERLGELGTQLVQLWRDPTLPLAERKRRLFALWDECAEPIDAPASPFDALHAAAGASARAKIAAYVRRVAPRGSPDAFTPEELARLNADRRSRARFDPYAAQREPAIDRELPELDERAPAIAAVPVAPPSRRIVGPEPPPAAPR